MSIEVKMDWGGKVWGFVSDFGVVFGVSSGRGTLADIDMVMRGADVEERIVLDMGVSEN